MDYGTCKVTPADNPEKRPSAILPNAAALISAISQLCHKTLFSNFNASPSGARLLKNKQDWMVEHFNLSQIYPPLIYTVRLAAGLACLNHSGA